MEIQSGFIDAFRPRIDLSREQGTGKECLLTYRQPRK